MIKIITLKNLKTLIIIEIVNFLIFFINTSILKYRIINRFYNNYNNINNNHT